MLLALSSLSLLSAAVLPLVPLYARDVLEVGARGYGVLGAALAGGMLAGALVLAAIGHVARPHLAIVAARLAWFASMAGFAVSGSFALSVALLAIIGLSGALSTNLTLTQFQVHAEDRMRGRVMSIERIADSLDPVGMVLGGALATLVGPQPALLACAGVGAALLALIAVAGRGQLWRAWQAPRAC
jgi:hypothetical protein